MQIRGLDLQQIPQQRRVRADTDLRQFLLADRKAFEAQAAGWVRGMSHAALAMALASGNPKTYTVGINGTTKGNNIREGFKAGGIDQAQTSVRIEFIGDTLANIANAVRPILRSVIAETFPQSAHKYLESRWIWWIARDALLHDTYRPVRLGARVPENVGIYDVLFLAPTAPAFDYGLFASSLAKYSRGASYNMVTARSGARKGQHRLRKRITGFVGEATKRSRALKQPGVLIQGLFVKKTLSGPESRVRFGVPVIRVAFKRGLKTAVSV